MVREAEGGLGWSTCNALHSGCSTCVGQPHGVGLLGRCSERACGGALSAKMVRELVRGDKELQRKRASASGQPGVSAEVWAGAQGKAAEWRC